MATTPPPGPPNLEHQHLRSALEWAVAVALAYQKQRPPLPYPPELKPLLKQQKVPGGALGKVRRILDANPDFRERVAGTATPDMVDEIGLEWLRRDDGWVDRVDALVDEAALALTEGDTALKLKRAERRRESAEQDARRARADLAAVTAQLAERERELRQRELASSDVSAEVAGLRSDLAAARLAERHAKHREAAARTRHESVATERDEALARARAAEEQRDALLAARAAAAGVSVAAPQVSELRALAEIVRGAADRLAALVDTRGTRRAPIAVPGSLARDPRKAAEHLLRTAGVLVLVDGYNVAKLTWPGAELDEQRERLLDAVDVVARRFGAEIAVVFDGADVTGSHTRQRRLARVRYSPAGVLADDVIRGEVVAADASRPVIVVTNDGAVRKDVVAAGANVVASDAFAAIALGA